MKRVDPLVAADVVAGMSAGEAVGVVIGRTLGVVGVPAGIALVASLGSFAGSSIGSKLGYDVTREWGESDDAPKKISLDDQLRAVGQVLVKKSVNTNWRRSGCCNGRCCWQTVCG